MKGYSAILGISLILAAGAANAADLGFAESEDEMVQLLKPKPVQYSTTRGLTRSMLAPPAQQTRSIRVKVKDEYGQEKTTVVQEPVEPAGSTVRMKIEFDVNSAAIRSSAYHTLAMLSGALSNEEVSGQHICIKGHTDSDGTDQYNMELSYARAYAVLDYLNAQPGVHTENIQVFGYGESSPLVDNISSSNKQLNRRVEVSTQCPAIY